MQYWDKAVEKPVNNVFRILREFSLQDLSSGPEVPDAEGQKAGYHNAPGRVALRTLVFLN